MARFGGDEFVVFQQNIHSADDAAGLARRVVDRLSERYKIDNHLVEIGASVGIAMTEHGVSADTLLKNADMALYRAKADGRGTFCFFRDEMAQIVELCRILELDLRKALANEEFELFFQPLVNLKSGRISTCEALLRWDLSGSRHGFPDRYHSDRGGYGPDRRPRPLDFAQGLHGMHEMARRRQRRGQLLAAAIPPARRAERSPLRARGVRSAGAPARNRDHRVLAAAEHAADARRAAQLHSLGVRISLDDFGTGYSSLSYLHNFPLQKVKIDRSFLEGIDSDRPLTLLRGVARLSADLGMSVVVEGIETNEQLELISADGAVTEAQGYLFSPPVPAVRVRQLLNASHGRRPPDGQLIPVASRSIA